MGDHVLDFRAVNIKHTARQLGVSEGQVTTDTVIPNIHDLVANIASETGEIGFIEDVHGKYTVAKAIKLF